LISRAELPQPPEDESSEQPTSQPEFRGRGRENRVIASELDKILRGRSIGWVLGTSICFEGLTLSLAAWIFCRRDY
jgi:hypothetical protein